MDRPHTTASIYSRFIAQQRAAGQLIVQPRMGFGTLEAMRDGLLRVKQLDTASVGTITLDSYTRVGDFDTPRTCLLQQEKLNGFPIVTHDLAECQAMLDGVLDGNFPVQVRHGTAEPQAIFKRLAELGLDATEGGPVSYCLPYSGTALKQAIAAWDEACAILAEKLTFPHIESFGGCMLGQLCPPSLLICLTLLECLYFIQRGIPSVSLSYAQGTSDAQDTAAIAVIHHYAERLLGAADWHIVMYTYMGVYPASTSGALALVADSAALAKRSGCHRLIVKTRAESRQIATIEENLEALSLAHQAASRQCYQPQLSSLEADYYQTIHAEVGQLLEAVLNLNTDIGRALRQAFRRGLLDVPYCLHADNAGLSRSYIDANGALQWSTLGKLPIQRHPNYRSATQPVVDSNHLLVMLYYKSSLYDEPIAHG
ncbi:MAG: methylaspartate mutase [Wenzhouxiangellaceae bacterium]